MHKGYVEYPLGDGLIKTDVDREGIDEPLIYLPDFTLRYFLAYAFKNKM